MPEKTAPLQRITTVRDARLSVWQSVVAHRVREEARTLDPTLDTGALSRKVRAHPMMRAASAHAVLHIRNTPLHEAGPVMQKHGTDASMVSQSQLYFEMAEAKRTGNQELLTQLESIPERRFSTDDWVGWSTCMTEYLVYYRLGPKMRAPIYRDWKDAKFGNGNINYSVIKYQLPATCKIGVIGDWGTGMDDAVALFDALVAMKPDAIIHVGDIYYSGIDSECTHNFLNVVQQTYQKHNVKIPIFTLPGNHEYYSGGVGYYQLLDQLASVQPSPDCQQSASYFCLRTADGALQFLGMDTGYYDHTPFTAVAGFTLVAPPLQPNEIAWHKNKLDNFKGITLLFSHHQLFSASATLNHYWWGTPYLNDRLFATFEPYFESIAGWIWGHEHNLAAYVNNAFGLSMGRLIGASSYEETQAENPYGVVYPEVPYLPNGPQLRVRDSYMNHTFAMIAVTAGQMPSITYYEFPSWGDDSPQNPQPTQLFSETFAKPAPNANQLWVIQTDGGRSKNVVNLLPAFGVLFANSVSNGPNSPPFLYKLNPMDGQAMASRTAFVQPVRGEMRFGSFADSLLLGANGALLSWDQNFEQNWQVAIPNGTGVVNIVADSQRIYTACAGYVTSFDPATGQMLHQNPMHGVVTNEIKLVLAQGMLFAVVAVPDPLHGGVFVFALNPSDVSEKWRQNPDYNPAAADLGIWSPMANVCTSDIEDGYISWIRTPARM